jgi:SAM-dependent methyltransferase
MTSWEEAQVYEANAWGRCLNTFHEELKQTVYARAMRIPSKVKGSVLDIGGGPTSMLLKFANVPSICRRAVCDPLTMPPWVHMRYEAAGITWLKFKAEEMPLPVEPFDEVWVYNVLQHVENPQKVIEKAKASGKLVRIFDWIDMKPFKGHINMVSEAQLNEWFGARGYVMEFAEYGCFGKAYFGVFGC